MRSGARHKPVTGTDTHASPTTGVPLRQGRTLGADGGVVAVTGVDPGRIVEAAEQALLDVCDQLGERLVVIVIRGADAAGEERVAGEEVIGAVGVAERQRDRTGV